MSRDIDWRAFIDKLVFCYGCGRFGVPKKGALPREWTTLYQPHGDAPVGLPACSEACKTAVRAAMMQGPVLMPLASVTDIMMSSEMRNAMMREAEQFASSMQEEGLVDEAFESAVEGDE